MIYAVLIIVYVISRKVIINYWKVNSDAMSEVKNKYMDTLW
jgi:hypothetical protein